MLERAYRYFCLMTNAKNILITLFVLFLAQSPMPAQRTELPSIGAQVFVEPGQSARQIDGWFATLERNDLKFARIRMFGSHVCKENGEFDFSLYDTAFDAAARHGIKLFVTLFPTTDELSDVGGFKFPKNDAHLEEVGVYIDHVVGHFKDHEAMYAWVLQNEPGTGSLAAPKTELSAKIRKQWREANPPEPRNGYLKADMSDQEFLVYYTLWYLDWISQRIQQQDTVHYRHINPHQILEILPEYDFAALEKVLTSLGASMHLSWHFSYFEREEFPVGISLMADIIRGSALSNPFWITELQGGNVTASGYRVLCPRKDEVTQWLWTGIGAGAQGIIFWTLNQRMAVSEAGEWGLLDFLDGESDRLIAAREVAQAVDANADIFSKASPETSAVSILYNSQSLWMQKKTAAAIKDDVNEGRSKGAIMKSVAGAYDAIAAWGITPDVRDMKFYDWEQAEGKTVILPNIICIPSEYYDKIRSFVSRGGRLIVTGLSGYYNENMACAFMGGFPLADVFGAQMMEVKAEDSYFPLPAYNGITLDSHLWRGCLKTESAAAMLKFGDDVCACRNSYGKGEVIWMPELIELGNWHRNEQQLSLFYGKLLEREIASAAISFKKPSCGVVVRTMTTEDKIITIICNPSQESRLVVTNNNCKYSHTIFDNKRAKADQGRGYINLLGGECAVIAWNK